MNRITFPLQFRMSGPAIVDLQDALKLFLERRLILSTDNAARRELAERLKRDRAEQTYGEITLKLVTIFQEERQLEASGVVDEATAKAMNALLDELGKGCPAPQDQQRLVSGQVRRDDGQLLAGYMIRTFHLYERRKLRLGEDRTDIEGQYTIQYNPLPGVEAVNLRVVVFDAKDQPLTASKVVADAASLEFVDIVVPSVTATTYRVDGKVASRVSAGIGELNVQVIDKAVGQDVTLARAVTNEKGQYQATFTDTAVRQQGKTKPDLQARVFQGDRFLAASDIRYNATPHETLDVLVDDKAVAVLQSEYATLTRDLRQQFRGGLGALQETDDRQDITYLANKTGWDARAVAIASLADQFSARTVNENGAVEIAPPFFYALFRAGIPANENALYQLDGKHAEAVWQKAVNQGVIPANLKDQLPQVQERFQRLAATQLLNNPAVVGVSSLQEMLSMTLNQTSEQERFTQLYTQHRGDRTQFWQAVSNAFGATVEQRLKIDGQLGYLTINNAPLIRRLHSANGQRGITDVVRLVEQGYFRAETWQTLMGDIAVPTEVPGKNADEKRANYSDLLATQIRLSFPTAVVAQMVRSGETPLSNGIAPEPVYRFLQEQQEQFELGMQPVEQYIARNNLQVAPETTQEIKRIQRVYQITPSDRVMNTLLGNGLDSAYTIVNRYDKAEFVQAFQGELGGEEIAALTYAKSQQISNVALNIATAYVTANRAPGIGLGGQFLSPKTLTAADRNGTADDVIAYPTLESLLGEMDYCTCEHCRSILSPAAYLVDLLLFCDRPLNERENPQAVLLERRPDIQHLPLTCENTNTPLPYIDVVNETLEYFVTNSLSLENYQGHNTEQDATPEELLASPQFVSDAAYETLVTTVFPPPLPFHQALDNLRRYFKTFEVPLSQAMEVLRKDDALERATPDAYGWRDILMEELQLSRAEYTLLSDRTITLQQLYGFDPATSMTDVTTTLANAKTFARRLSISYEDLIEILRTQFINPNAYLIPKLERLGVPFSTLKNLKDGTITDAEFDALLDSELDAAQYGGDIKAWIRDDANYAKIMGLIVLTNPTAEGDRCSFDNLELRYANPDNTANQLRPFEYIRLIRFIRLWKKLGWTIAQTDKAIAALYPADQMPNDSDDTVNHQRLDAGFLVLLPRLGHIKQVMPLLKLKPKTDLLSLLACFAPIDTHGDAALYRQMFLSSALLKQDEAFAEDGYGNFLTDANQKLLTHREALRAAFLLTDDEFTQITTHLGFDADTVLTLDTISPIFRHGWLARKLKLSAQELLRLIQFTGLDPFAAPDPVNPAILRFIKLVQRLRSSSLKPVETLYLLWNQDISGISAPPEAEIWAFAQGLRRDFGAIASEFVVTDDPEGQIARSRMALVYGNDATDFFFGLLEKTLATRVSYSHGQATLEQPILDVAPGQLSYDDFGKELTFSSVLTEALRDALKAVAGVSTAFQTAVDTLYGVNQALITPFFDRYPELRPLYDAFVASSNPAEQKRSELLANFLPELRERRQRQQAMQSASAAAKVDVSFASALLDDALVLHAAADTTQAALNDLMAIETPGLAAQFFFRDTATGTVDDRSLAEANLAYAAGGDNPLPAHPTPGGSISGLWSGYLEAPENGFYNLQIEANSGATVTVTFTGASVALTQDGTRWSNTDPIELKAGTLYAIAIQAERIQTTFSVRWQTLGRGWEVIPSEYLYSDALMEPLHTAYLRFLKLSSLAVALNLTAGELSHLAVQPTYFISGEAWPNQLPISGSPDIATSTGLLLAFEALLQFADMKEQLSPDDERLLTVLQDPVAATADATSLLFTLTQWQSSSLDALLVHFGKAIGDLSQVEVFHRLYAAYQVVKQLEIPVDALLQATTNEPTATTVRNLQSALRARYDESNWLQVLKPINDELRGLQRNALVAYILHQMRSNPVTAHIDTANKLFEYFLMDVQMEPCTQTSRIRHALSSVQLFIERCMMNLEPRVAPSSFESKQRQQWAWMKRYRVWEANRKVFLYPENWLEPELRDDQSPFFKETIGELLQGDITEERAAVALLNYLSRLEEVAKLEPCGIHYVENDPGTTDDIAHVVARTPGANRKYFYRRREYGYWTPWEQIQLDIEDNPVLPVVWRDRLFLFWLRILKQVPQEAPSLPSGSLQDTSPAEVVDENSTKITVQAVLCWSEYFNEKWQPVRTSDVEHPLTLGTNYEMAGTNAFERSKLKLSAFFYTNNSLRIIVSNEIGAGASFFLYNTHSLPELRNEKKNRHFSPKRLLDTETSTLNVNYPNSDIDQPVLRNDIGDRTVEPHQPLSGNPWDTPFFYADNRHVFYVTTAERLVLIPQWVDFGILTPPPSEQLEIPPLVLQPVDVIPNPIDPVIRQPGFGVVDPSPVERYIAEDAYIDYGIGSMGTVRFGDKEIGPMGSQTQVLRTR